MAYKQVRDMRPEQVQRRVLGQTAKVVTPPKSLPHLRVSVPPTRSQQSQPPQLPHTEDLPRQGSALFFLGIGMCGCLLLMMFMAFVVIPWWNGLLTQW